MSGGIAALLLPVVLAWGLPASDWTPVAPPDYAPPPLLAPADAMDAALAHPDSTVARWAAATPDHYVSRVKPGNQTALNQSAVPFASYLNGMHNRIHPLFTGRALAWWTKRQRWGARVTRLEIVLKKDGAIEAVGVVRSSGDPFFDAIALEAFALGAPFGPTPAPIQSADGRVYVHWELNGDPVLGCSTIGARPFLLANTP
jgi:TonB family protein